MVYYGLVLSGGTLPGNIFINNAIGGLMDVVSMLIAIPFITKIGCTKTVSISLFVGGGSCIVSTIIVQLSKGNTAFFLKMTLLKVLEKKKFCKSFLNFILFCLYNIKMVL